MVWILVATYVLGFVATLAIHGFITSDVYWQTSTEAFGLAVFWPFVAAFATAWLCIVVIFFPFYYVLEKIWEFGRNEGKKRSNKKRSKRS